ncbi:hypothetical protein [uncultured Helicobacter sp.]|uniref:hypothetical protein n=1 Tax=uncultured Helicobacter sp. TaxID=175537 RepID=UPI00374F3A62
MYRIQNHQQYRRSGKSKRVDSESVCAQGGGNEGLCSHYRHTGFTTQNLHQNIKKVR